MCIYWAFLAFFIPVEPAIMVLPQHAARVILRLEYLIFTSSIMTRVTRALLHAPSSKPKYVKVELFPHRCRGLANSIAYNIALAIFGGLVSSRRLQGQKQLQQLGGAARRLSHHCCRCRSCAPRWSSASTACTAFACCRSAAPCACSDAVDCRLHVT